MKPSFIQKYQRVRQKEAYDSTEDLEKTGEDSSTSFELLSTPHSCCMRSSTWSTYIHWIPWLLLLCLLISNWYAWEKLNIASPNDAIFSPAKSAIRYKNVVFNAGVDGDVSPYQGRPNEENNRLWEELFQFGVSRVPMSDAVQLENRTTPIPNDPGNYVVTLDVFHQLHCVNQLRRRIFWNETSQGPIDEEDMVSMKHMDHCIDSLRQSLMCTSDITPIPFAWYPKYQQVLPTTGVTHTCRDFDAIRDWARERRATKMDLTVHVDDPLGNVVYGS